jgi:cyanate permease
MDACVLGSHVINQSVIYDLPPQARSRLTTVCVTTMFAGGAIGSTVGAQVYEHRGWLGATLIATAFPVAGLFCWSVSRAPQVRPGPDRLSMRQPARGQIFASVPVKSGGSSGEST